ncbi:transforming growth factor beta activator LRRC32-like [Poeciliopsis prolifica]|uniref:transforming growth factor beta activator LRRC32-like n=1 Tax=Poeciliopsis prolifica TaxID=188132 RepID=UPI00241359F4|nr:transforming growth factor beta activator LRRC32-like [Poeciliopsis prolifica]
MVRHTFSNLVLLWSIILGFYRPGGTHLTSKNQSWNNQNLSSVPLDLDVRLRRLDLSNNFITQLHSFALPYLEELDLSGNQMDLISEAAFVNLARLEHLNLSRNRLSVSLGSNSKALRSLGGLRSLDISMNGLSNGAAELLLRNKSSLDQLMMTGNVLIKLSPSLFRESKRIRTLIIEDNLISEIAPQTFEPLSQLESLNLARNNLAFICDFTLHQVKYLNLSRNSVEFFVTPEDAALYNLEVLDLSHNKLLYFPILPKMNRLKYLHLQNNLLGALDSEAVMVTEVNSLYQDVVNESVLQKNYFHANWRPMPLIYINLSFNRFASFPLETLSLLNSLETLNFSYNCLQNINWDVRNYSDPRQVRQIIFHSLKHLDLQGNGLTCLPLVFLKTLTQIETLNLQDNSLQPCGILSGSLLKNHTDFDHACTAFGQLKTLRHLNLRENDIKILLPNAFQGTSLISLNLAKNLHMLIHEMALEGVQTTLQSLIISGININGSGLSLPCMPALTEINISNNKLNATPSSLRCSSLKVIDVRNNDFMTLNYSLVEAVSTNLTTVYISGNRFNCCDSRWLTVLNDMRVKLPDISQAKCFTQVRNLTMSEYLKSPLFYCSSERDGQEVHFGGMVITLLFVTVLSLALFFFSRKLCCSQRSSVV